MKNIRVRSLLLTAIVISTIACSPASHYRIAAMMDDAESCINERPDSALAVLERIDPLP